MAVNVVIKILQGSVVTETVLGGLSIHHVILQLMISYSVNLPKVVKVGWQ